MNLDKSKSYLIFLDRNKAASWDYYSPAISKGDLEGISFKTLSEYRGCDYQYSVDKSSGTLDSAFWSFFESLDCSAIIDRCRVLRHMETERAREQIKRALSFCFHFFQQYQFDTLITFCVDRYTLDIMVRVAKHFGLEVIGFGGSFIPGTRRSTIFGEPQSIREVTEEEVIALYDKLCKPYSSSGKPAIKQARMAALKWYVSSVVRYIYHYLLLHKIVGKMHYDYLLVKRQPRTFFYNLLFNNKKPFQLFSEIDLKNKLWEKKVYIPLHFHPEATVDYWTDSPKKAYYLDSLCEVISFYGNKGYQVVLKEHPAMYLTRSASFYKTLLQYDNVLLAWPFLETLTVFKYIDKVIIWTGTTGIEAAVNRKHVYLYSNNFWDKGFFKNWKEVDQPSTINKAQSLEILRGFLENITGK